ncbi:hypothetical protein A2737_02170 [Candidatus Nomurabacteria bacterium RIFCSPHIGHO2_01_FULL_41_71]|nr:MAG: hypothetical protein A2737_02170 [Candidatus Nomurabacteria bacterium RIFCSPHIGHO2_01_FULL_41_71]
MSRSVKWTKFCKNYFLGKGFCKTSASVFEIRRACKFPARRRGLGRNPRGLWILLGGWATFTFLIKKSSIFYGGVELKTFLKKVLRFSIAGGTGVLSGYVALYSLTEFVGWWYIWSAFVAFVLNTGVTFYLQRFWTFKNESLKPFSPKQFIMYSMMTASFVGSNIILLYLLVEYVHLHYMVAQVCLTALFSVFSFVLTPKIFTR